MQIKTSYFLLTCLKCRPIWCMHRQIICHLLRGTRNALSSTCTTFTNEFMLEEKRPSSPTLARVYVVTAAVRSDKGLYAQWVGSDRRKLPSLPIKVWITRTRDDSELVACLVMPPPPDAIDRSPWMRVYCEADSCHGCSDTA